MKAFGIPGNLLSLINHYQLNFKLMILSWYYKWNNNNSTWSEIIIIIKEEEIITHNI